MGRWLLIMINYYCFILEYWNDVKAFNCGL